VALGARHTDEDAGRIGRHRGRDRRTGGDHRTETERTREDPGETMPGSR
jgi:hypothetical protein